MKKIYNSARVFIALIVLTAWGSELNAQALNGVYTINQGAATQGSNFNNFNDLAAELALSGISGPVEVNVVPFSGPYVEQVEFDEISGANAQNRITINGNDNLITFSSSNSNMRYVIGMNSADFFTFKDLNVEGTGNYAYCAFLYMGADNNTFSNCTFSVPANSSSSNQIPVVFSGSGNNYSTQSNSANNTLFEDCIMFSGYAGVWIYGNTANPYNENNRIINCEIADWYYYGIYTYYQKDIDIKGNLIHRPFRTSTSTTYGMRVDRSQGAMIEENKIQDLFKNMNSSSTCYGAYLYYNSASNGENRNHFRNNIIANLETNGTLYGMRVYYLDGGIYHNTISLDDLNATGGTTYGMYLYSQSGAEVAVTNNIVSISRGGSGTKYGVYWNNNSAASQDYNIINMNAQAGTNYIGRNGSTVQQGQWAQWQGLGMDANGSDMDPMFADISTNDLHPTEPLINNLALPMNVVFDNEGAVRNQQSPDFGALEFLTPSCNGTPNQFVAGASFSFCPGEIAELGTGILHPEAGYTYQWQVSTLSQVGPFTPIPGANGLFYTTPPVTQNSWYNLVMTCTNPGGGVASPVATIMVAGTTTNSVPYLEDFEGIGKQNRLPNCSWTSPNLGGAAKTYTSSQTGNRLPYEGTSFATFEAGSGGTYYYYSNGIWLDPGITYSASMFYQTDFTGATNWTDLSILVGTVQAQAGLTQVASTNGAAVSPIYKLLSNTFTVASSGLYYVAVRASASSGQAEYLSWDNLKIDIPCSETENPISVSLLTNNTTICSGTALNLAASGADAYLWNNGATSAAISVTPQVSGYYSVTGTNMITGCSGTASLLITVKKSPAVTLLAVPPVVCSGKPVNLVAGGASTYTWSAGGNGQIKIVVPTASMGYTVIGSSGGCTAKSAVFVAVNGLPTISAFASSPVICEGEEVILTGVGAVTYTWHASSSSVIHAGTNITDKPPFGQTTYTVIGTDANGCDGVSTTNVIIDECAGLSKIGAAGSIRMYPNPTSGVFSIESADNDVIDIEVSDVTGRIIYSAKANGSAEISLDEYASGIYYVKVISGGASDVMKLIKE